MIQKSNMWSVISLFFIDPTKNYYLLDISKKIGLAHTSVKKYLEELVKLGIIISVIEKRGTRKFPLYKANQENKEYKGYKKIYNLSSINDSGAIEYINDKLMPKCIVLFGSYQRGEDTKESDIDLFIECEKENIDLSEYEKLLSRKIELRFNRNFNDYPKELKNNIINGVVLKGFLEVFK